MIVLIEGESYDAGDLVADGWDRSTLEPHVTHLALTYTGPSRGYATFDCGSCHDQVWVRWPHEPAETPEPVGAVEIARRLGVERATVDKWQQRDLLPAPAWTVGGRPAWDWSAIERWARSTGRLRSQGGTR